MNVWLKRSLGALAVVLVLAVCAELLRANLPPEAKDFTGTDLSGKPWSLAEHRGRRPILVNFIGTH